jgi:hypothetical protein
MSEADKGKPNLSRRRFLSCGFMAAATAGLTAHGAPAIIGATDKNDEAQKKSPSSHFMMRIREEF